MCTWILYRLLWGLVVFTNEKWVNADVLWSCQAKRISPFMVINPGCILLCSTTWTGGT